MPVMVTKCLTKNTQFPISKWIFSVWRTTQTRAKWPKLRDSPKAFAKTGKQMGKQTNFNPSLGRM